MWLTSTVWDSGLWNFSVVWNMRHKTTETPLGLQNMEADQCASGLAGTRGPGLVSEVSALFCSSGPALPASSPACRCTVPSAPTAFCFPSTRAPSVCHPYLVMHHQSQGTLLTSWHRSESRRERMHPESLLSLTLISWQSRNPLQILALFFSG